MYRSRLTIGLVAGLAGACAQLGCAPKFVQLGSAGAYTCGLSNRHRVECWQQGAGLGDYDFGQTAPPDLTFDQIAVALGQACGLTTDGELTCWGVAAGVEVDGWPVGYGQTVNQAGPFEEISTGDLETCGIDSSGNLHCWGGQTDWPPTVASGQVDPGGSTAHISVQDEGCAVRSDGSVDCWGYFEVHDPGPFDSVTAFWQACALDDGTPTCWDDSGRTGASEPPSGLTLSQISAGQSAVCGLTESDGTLVCWGEDEYGAAVELANHWDGTDPTRFTAVSTVGDSSICGIQPDGGIVCSGIPEGSFETPSWGHPRYPTP